MKYGCIGEKLSHSFSKEIHNLLADYPYEICEVARDDLAGFMENADFLGINVTIPYKEQVIPHLYKIDEAAERIGAVNTIVKKDGRLYGYNTDFYGMTMLLAHAGVTVKDKTVAILGTGGTSKTARAVCEALGARKILTVSRREGIGVITYRELCSTSDEIDVIINTTPVGMYPHQYESPVDIADFPRLGGVIDAIYNPLRSELVSAAIKRGIPAEGGLYMLVAQAVRASEIFLDTEYTDKVLEGVYSRILSSKENVVLVGMPASGKSTVGAILAKRLGRELIDTDALIVEAAGEEISNIFATRGEAAFRDMETEAVKRAAAMTAKIVATGGGAILRDENVEALKQNGRLFFLDRPVEKLIPTDSRPLASNEKAIRQRYSERYSRYSAVSDERIDCDRSADEVAEIIGEKYR